MRQGYARAMYDQIEDALASITMQLRSAIQADAQMPRRVNGSLLSAAGPLHRASGWGRQVVAELGGVLLHSLGLVATIEWHLHQFRKITGILCELTVNVTDGFGLPEEYAETIFDIYGEAMSNVARHTDASRVAITLTITPHEVCLVVRDNGIGLSDEVSLSSKGGIAGMRKSAQFHKGRCEFAGVRNAGTTVTATLPVVRLQ